MKKSIIAAGAASVALAAMPIVSTFATTTVGPVNDAITAVIDNGCTISDSTEDKHVNINVTPGSVATTSAAASISVICNNSSWHIQAAGAGTGGSATNVLFNAGDDSESTTDDSEIATGTATEGTTSNWAFNIANPSLPTNVTKATGYTSWAAIPASATNIIDGAAPATVTINTQYRVYAKTGEVPGTYTGKVAYTVVY